MPAIQTAGRRATEPPMTWISSDQLPVTEFDLNQPSVSRVDDYLLGRAHNFAVDRDFGRRIVGIQLRTGWYAQVNRAFLGRVVRFLVGAGVRQFVELGSGLPAAGALREVATTARVVYVDIDPVAVAFTRLTVGEGDRVEVVCVDVRKTVQLLPEVAATGVIDFGRPIGLLMAGLLNFITDEDDPAQMLHSFRQVLAPSSVVALSHASTGPDG